MTHGDPLKMAALIAVETIQLYCATNEEKADSQPANTLLGKLFTVALSEHFTLLATNELICEFWDKRVRTAGEKATRVILEASASHHARLSMLGVSPESLCETLHASLAIHSSASTAVDDTMAERTYNLKDASFLKSNYWYVFMYLVNLGNRFTLIAASKGRG